MEIEPQFKSLLKENLCQVFLLASPAHLPVSFAIHPWFVIHENGRFERYEVVHTKCNCPTRFDQIHIDALPPFSGIGYFAWSKKLFWKTTLLGYIEGIEAEAVATLLRESITTYPHRKKYRLLGPNSNTYAQWILDASPAWKTTLPKNAYGKNYGK